MTPSDPSPEGSPSLGFKRRGRIVLSLFAMLALVGLVPLATVSWKLIELNREALTGSQQEYQLLLARSLALEVEGHVEAQHSQLLSVAQTLGAALHGGGKPPRRELEEVLREVAVAPVLYTRMSYGSDRGGGSLSAGELPVELEAVFRISIQKAVEQLSLSEPSEFGPVVSSQPILPDPQSPGTVMVLSAPVRSGGRLRGVLSAVVDLQAVWSQVTRRYPTGRTAFVLDSDGLVIASSDPASVRPGHEARRNQLVDRFLSGSAVRASETAPYTEETASGPERYLGSYVATDHQWGVFVCAHERLVFRELRKNAESALTFAAVALLLAGLAAMIFAPTLSTPISRLAAAAHAVTEGDLTIRVATRSRNEIGELAYAFNGMTERIESQIQSLQRAAEENRQLFLGTIRALAEAIDAKDRYTRGHSMRVNRYSVIIAQTMGLDDNAIRDINIASLLHDIGKIGIDDRVLNKPGKLTPEEFEIMKRHPALGANIMARIPQMKQILPGLRWHHERWQGGGYPDGLKGEEIPLMARIISVADTFDAMTTTRPYQRTYSAQEALEVIKRLKGQVLNERVVEAFYRAYGAGKIRVDAPEEPLADVPASVISA